MKKKKVHGAYPRVCMLIPSFYPVVGGAERQAAGLCREMKEIGIDTFVLTRQVLGTLKRESVDGINVIRLPSLWYPFFFLLTSFIYLVLNKNHYDIIHVHTLNSPGWIAGIVGYICRKPILIKVTRSGHGSQLEGYKGNRWKKFIFARFQKLVKFFIAITEDVKTGLIEAGVPEDKIILIPNGVVVPHLDVNRKTIQNVEDGEIICLCVGRLIVRKRFDMVIKAWAAQEKINGAKLFIIGEGPEKNHLEQLAEHLNVADSVHFLGTLDHESVLKWLTKAQCFILASDSEGMSNALLEAMASGLSVIVSDIKAHESIVKDGINGFVFSDFNNLKDKLQLLLNNKRSRQKLGINAREHIRAHHSFRMVALQNSILYFNVIN